MTVWAYECDPIECSTCDNGALVVVNRVQRPGHPNIILLPLEFSVNVLCLLQDQNLVRSLELFVAVMQP